jgi:hypothetical protein
MQDVGLTKGKCKIHEGKYQSREKADWRQKAGSARPEAEARSGTPCIELVQSELGHLGCCLSYQFEENNVADYWQIMTLVICLCQIGFDFGARANLLTRYEWTGL